ncbi:hypothetical protein [Pseudoroseomonas sp. WGS1072]|uniref:hypothetical protein n=1 Tax=Roseomonas sp. WGS1072 TaxID=3366816 RepID=UPI003BF26885
MLKIRYSAELCGAGKTWWACRHIAEKAGRYLLVVDRRAVFSDRKNLISRFASEVGTFPKIVEIFSASDEWIGGRPDVRRAVREAGCEHASQKHVVVLLTHEALKSSDLSTYRDNWHCIIDEVPTLWTHSEVCSPVLGQLLEKTYNLEPILKEGWSALRVKADGPSLTDYYADTVLSGWGDIHRQIRDRDAFAKIGSWQDAASRSSWSLVSIWNPESLRAFSQVTLLGNAFEHTVTYKLLERHFGDVVKLEPFAVPTTRHVTWQPRKLLIRYFAKSHRAGSAFWATADGRECLRRIPWWVNAHTQRGAHYWSCNNSLYGSGQVMDGRRVSPKIAGENGLRNLTCGTFIYSAKPSQREREALSLFGISFDEVVRSREYEDLIQMLWRSSLRDAADTRSVEFRVYDQQQAELLLGFMAQAAPHVAVTLEQIDLGLDAFKPRKTGRPKKDLTVVEATAKKEREKLQAAERQRKRRQNRDADRDLDLRGDSGGQRGIDPPPFLAPSPGPSATPPPI